MVWDFCSPSFKIWQKYHQQLLLTPELPGNPYSSGMFQLQICLCICWKGSLMDERKRWHEVTSCHGLHNKECMSFWWERLENYTLVHSSPESFPPSLGKSDSVEIIPVLGFFSNRELQSWMKFYSLSMPVRSKDK